MNYRSIHVAWENVQLSVFQLLRSAGVANCLAALGFTRRCEVEVCPIPSQESSLTGGDTQWREKSHE